MPMSCNEELCQYQLQGVMMKEYNLYNFIEKHTEIATLKINAFYNAFKSSRRTVLIKKMPPDMNDLEINKCFECIPQIDNIIKMQNNTNLKNHLDSIDKNIYKLLKWIMTNSQNYIKHIKDRTTLPQHVNELIKPADGKIKDIYEIINDNIDRSANFESLRSNPEYTIETVFHGTKPDCIHNIMYESVLNCSNTQLMTSGAAYGVGIYVGRNIDTSLSYSTNSLQRDWTDKHEKYCLILEFAKSRNNFRDVNGNFYVVPESKFLSIKYILTL